MALYLVPLDVNQMPCPAAKAITWTYVNVTPADVGSVAVAVTTAKQAAFDSAMSKYKTAEAAFLAGLKSAASLQG